MKPNSGTWRRFGEKKLENNLTQEILTLFNFLLNNGAFLSSQISRPLTNTVAHMN